MIMMMIVMSCDTKTTPLLLIWTFVIACLVCKCCFIALLLHLLGRKSPVDNDGGIKVLESIHSLRYSSITYVHMHVRTCVHTHTHISKLCCIHDSGLQKHSPTSMYF